jgi:RimJ/RimL family protein N-acetyltransferase
MMTMAAGQPEVVLQPFTADDFTRLIGWIPSTQALVQWAGPSFHFPLDPGQADEYLAPARGPSPMRRIFRAVSPPADEVVGHIDLSNIDPENRVASVCRVLIDPARRGLGLGEQMVRQVVRIGFYELHLHRLDLRVFDFNAPAIACYEKVGFVREGRLRDWVRMQDTYWSVLMMSLLETDWHEG